MVYAKLLFFFNIKFDKSYFWYRNKATNYYCGGIFRSRPTDMFLVAFWLFLLTYIEEKFLPLLLYKREPKREEYHQLSSFYCGSIFAFGLSVALVISGFFCYPILKESPSPLDLISMSWRSKDTTSSLNAKGEGDSFDVRQ